MQTTWFRVNVRRGAVVATAGLALLVAACQPIIDPNALEGQLQPDATELAGQPDATEEATAEGTPEATVEATGEVSGTVESTGESTPELVGIEPAQATISATSLRVRAEPDEESDVVAGAREGETYPVMGISSDGAWIQLEIERAPEGMGWVSSEFVTLQGDITNIPITHVVEGAEATPEATEEVTGTVEATATVEVSETVAATVTVEATPEATAEATEEVTATVEATATAEATTTVEVTATVETTSTAEAEETPTPEETPELTDPSTLPVPEPGFVVINSGDTPLRVRSEPSAEGGDATEVGHVFTGETYEILEISEDGEWIRIDVPQLDLPDGGWISAEFAIVGE